MLDRAIDPLKGLLGEDAVVTEALDCEQPAVRAEADFTQFRQVVQSFADGKVVGVVDRRFGAQSALLLVILLDPGVLVIDVEREGVTPWVRMRVRIRRGVRRVMRRSKISWTSSGRPISRLSRITCSKNSRPCTGRSSTWVRENSALRIEISLLKRALCAPA